MSDLLATIADYAAKRTDMSRPISEREWFDTLFKNRLDDAYSKGLLVPSSSGDSAGLPSDDDLLRLIRLHFHPVYPPRLVHTVWKDGIDIDEPSFELKQFLAAIAAKAPTEGTS